MPTPIDDAIFARVTHNTLRATIAGSALIATTTDVGSVDVVELEGPPPGFVLETEVDSTAQSGPEGAIPVHIAGRVVYQDISRCSAVFEGVPLVKVRLDWDDDLDPTTIRCVWPVQCGVEHIGFAYTDENGAFSFDFVVSGVQNLGQIAPRLALAVPQQNDACQRVISFDPGVHYFPDPVTFDLMGVTAISEDNILVEVGPEDG